MGIKGAGKNEVGKLLATKLGMKFFNANDYHNQGLLDKLESGNPLSDSDRLPWLKALNQLLDENKPDGMVLACSALKESYRYTLTHKHGDQVKWVYIGSDIDNLLNPEVESTESGQIEILEEPNYGIHLSYKDSPEENVAKIIRDLNLT